MPPKWPTPCPLILNVNSLPRYGIDYKLWSTLYNFLQLTVCPQLQIFSYASRSSACNLWMPLKVTDISHPYKKQVQAMISTLHTGQEENNSQLSGTMNSSSLICSSFIYWCNIWLVTVNPQHMFLATFSERLLAAVTFCPIFWIQPISFLCSLAD